MSDDEDEVEDPKQGHTPRGHVPLFKTVSCGGNLSTTTEREENVHDLVSPGTQLLTKSPANVILTDIEEENMSSESPQEELLRCHYCLVQCQSTRLSLLEALGIIPRMPLNLKLPKCYGCLYGAMTKRPWQTKSANNQGSIREDSAPG